MISTKVDSIKKKMSNIDIDQNNNSFVIIPYYHSGSDTITNNGYSEFQRDPKDFETFKQIWTGNDACDISWKNSTTLYQDQNGEMKISYQLGEYILGELEVDTRQVNVMRDKSYSEYTSQESEITLTFRVSKDFEFTPQYDFYFYKVPEIYKDIVFRLDSVEKNWIYDDFIGQRITLKSVNQDYANTGLAKQQNIMPNSPGQGYLNPIVKDKDWPTNFENFWTEKGEIHKFSELIEGTHYFKLENGKYLTGDFQKIMNRPIKKVIVKCFGVGIINSFVMTGRQVALSGNYDNYGLPEVLFPMNFITPTSPTYYRTQQETQNFYFGSFSPLINYIKDFMSNIKDMTTPLNKWENQGLLSFDLDKLKNTNQEENGRYKYSLFGEITNDESGNLIKNNWVFDSGETSVGGLVSYGVEVTYNLSGQKEIHNHMWDNYWITKEMKSLPISVKNSLGFGFTLGSSIGAMVTKQWWLGAALFAIGIVASFISWITTPKFKAFRGFISCEMIEINNQYKVDNMKNDCISFNILQSNSQDNPSSVFFDGSTINTSFEANITNLFKKNGVIYRTSNIGQSVDSEGNIINNGSPLFVNGDEELVEVENSETGFIIDSFKLCACFNGDISIEFKDSDDNIVWTGVYQSQGKWTKSLREIWTEKNCSVYGRENTFFSEPIPYPKELPIPTGGNLVLSDIKNNVNFTKQYSYSGENNNFKSPIAWDNKNLFSKGDGAFGTLVDGKSWYGEKLQAVCKWNSIYDYWDKEVIKEIEIFKYSDIIKDFPTFKKYFNEIHFSQTNIVNFWNGKGKRANSSQIRSVYNKKQEKTFKTYKFMLSDKELDTKYSISFSNEYSNVWNWDVGVGFCCIEQCSLSTLWKNIDYYFVEKDNTLCLKIVFLNKSSNIFYVEQEKNLDYDTKNDTWTGHYGVPYQKFLGYQNNSLAFNYFDIWFNNGGHSYTHKLNFKITPRPIYQKQ